MTIHRADHVRARSSGSRVPSSRVQPKTEIARCLVSHVDVSPPRLSAAARRSPEAGSDSRFPAQMPLLGPTRGPTRNRMLETRRTSPSATSFLLSGCPHCSGGPRRASAGVGSLPTKTPPHPTNYGIPPGLKQPPQDVRGGFSPLFLCV